MCGEIVIQYFYYLQKRMKRLSKRRSCILLAVSIFALAMIVDLVFYRSISYARIIGQYSRIRSYAVSSNDDDSYTVLADRIYTQNVEDHIHAGSENSSLVANPAHNSSQEAFWCQRLDSNLLEDKIHFYLNGTDRFFVSTGSLLEKTSCIMCNEVCRHVINGANGIDNDGGATWRTNLLNKLSGLIQEEIRSLQTPADCSSVNKIMCSLFHNNRGFGSQVHAMAYCLLLAYISNRTLVIKTERFRYGKIAWEETMEPIGTCFSKDIGDITEFTDIGDMDVILRSTAETITVPDVKAWRYPVPDFLFLAIPEDLAFTLTLLNDDPPSWWISQFIKYIFRLQPDILSDLQEEVEENFHGTVAGTHIRRTDSTVTGIYRNIKDYIVPVSDFFNRHKPPIDLSSQNIYVISDETSPFQELKDRYPLYNFIYNTTIAEQAVKKRNSLFGIVHDIYMMSHCDFVVCAASSNICRFIYEMVQSKGRNATGMFHFLDKLYFLSNKYQNRHVYKVISPIVGRSLEVGEIVERMFSNMEHGYITGIRCKTNTTAKFPVSKMKRVWLLTKKPQFKNIQ